MTKLHNANLKRTALYHLHVEAGAKLVAFAGYEMPLHYPDGIIAEHRYTRSSASLFDVSHMGQIVLRGTKVAEALEALVPGDIARLKKGQMRYTMLTNENGGILDDLIVTNVGSHLLLVVNAGRKEADFNYLRTHLPNTIGVDLLKDRGLIAVQGPAAAHVLDRYVSGVAKMPFMSSYLVDWDGSMISITRSGYTGEDGYEISMPFGAVSRITSQLLAENGVKLAGLGARDSLRMEAGLCLYGKDIDETTTPIEAGLKWSIGKRRREEGNFLGAKQIQKHLTDGAPRVRVGILTQGKVPARSGTIITDVAGTKIGMVTSGGFGPTAGRPVAMGYVDGTSGVNNTKVNLLVREKPRLGHIVSMPFIPHNYYRNKE